MSLILVDACCSYEHGMTADTAAVHAHVKAILKSVGRKEDAISADAVCMNFAVPCDVSECSRNSTVDATQVDYFVRNVRYLRVVRTRSLDQEYDAKTFNVDAVSESFSFLRSAKG